jgi:hypothetical protein
MLKNWINHKNRILHQKKGSRRARPKGIGVLQQIEYQLNAKFDNACAAGCKITYHWFIQHAKAIYRKLFP